MHSFAVRVRFTCNLSTALFVCVCGGDSEKESDRERRKENISKHLRHSPSFSDIILIQYTHTFQTEAPESCRYDRLERKVKMREEED